MASQVKVTATLPFLANPLGLADVCSIRCCFWGQETLASRRCSRYVFFSSSLLRERLPAQLLNSMRFFILANAAYPQSPLLASGN